MVAKDISKAYGSPPPFRSVKDDPASMKPKHKSAEGVVSKDRQLHLAQKEVSRLKELQKNAETAKGRALIELQRANQTVEDLTRKLKLVSDTKESMIKVTEEARNQVTKLKEANKCYARADDGSRQIVREQYVTAISKLGATKEELRKIREDCNALTEEKAAVLKRAEAAKLANKAKMDKLDSVSEEVATLQVSVGQLKLGTLHVKEEEAKIYADKDVQKQSYKNRLEQLGKTLDSLRKKIDPALKKNLENQLAKTKSEIEALRKEIGSTRASDLDLMKDVTTELNYCKESLHKVFEEKGSLRTLQAGIESELENVKKEHLELKRKETETESLAGNLHLRLQRAKFELEVALAEESKAKCAFDEMSSSVNQVRSECEKAKSEANEMEKQVEKLKKETDSARVTLEEAEKTLKDALEAAEEAKAAEDRALEQIKLLSERTIATCASSSESGAHITISRCEFEFFSQNVEESKMLAELKVAAAMAQLEAVKASENEALKRSEATRKEIDNIRAATEEAFKRAEMAEAAKEVVERELRRWSETEEKNAAKTTYCVVAETEMVFESFPDNDQNESFPDNDQNVIEFESQTDNSQEVRQPRKLDKSKTSVAKKSLLRNFSGMFPTRTKQENPVC